MIKLQISDLIFFYILFSVLIILLIWIVSIYKRGISYSLKNIDNIWKCSVCLHDYIDSKHEDISTCPLCGSYNKKEDQKKNLRG